MTQMRRGAIDFLDMSRDRGRFPSDAEGVEDDATSRAVPLVLSLLASLLVLAGGCDSRGDAADVLVDLPESGATVDMLPDVSELGAAKTLPTSP